MEVSVKKLLFPYLFLFLISLQPAHAVDYINGKTVAGCALLGVGLFNALQAARSLNTYYNAHDKLKKSLQICHIGMPNQIDHYQKKSMRALSQGIKSSCYALATGLTATVLLNYGMWKR